MACPSPDLYLTSRHSPAAPMRAPPIVFDEILKPMLPTRKCTSGQVKSDFRQAVPRLKAVIYEKGVPGGALGYFSHDDLLLGGR